MTTRHDARRTALEILYQADLTDAPAERVLAERRDAGMTVPSFADQLVVGVTEHLPEIDLLLEEHSQDWTVARMAPVDRTIMRIAVFELLHSPDVPSSVAISEAMEAASELSSDRSRAYVNGILGRIARERAQSVDPTEISDD